MPSIKNWRDALRGAQVDVAVGIAHAELAGDCDFRLHVTELKPGARVKAHMHHRGNELYIIESGAGKLYTNSTKPTMSDPSLEAGSTVQPHESEGQTCGWAGSVGAVLLGAVGGIVVIVVVLFAGIKLFDWLYHTFGSV